MQNMNMTRRTHELIRSESGFTLMEMLISLFLTGLISAAIMNTYINQHKQVIVQDQIVDAQQNARAAIDEITRQVRMAGFSLPLGLPAIEASNTNPDTITINYSSSECHASVTDPMPQPSAEVKVLDQDLSCFYDGQYLYIFDPDSGGGEWFTVTQVQQAAGHIQHNLDPFSRTYGPGAILISLDQIKFYVNKADTLHPNLMIVINGGAPQVYAENVSDLQFRYTLRDGTVTDAPTQAKGLREVKISLVARTKERDIDFLGNPYRRRSFSSSVHLRNLAG